MIANDNANPILVELTRGRLVESVHRGSIAISDPSGELRLALGDVVSPIYPRSACKMMQALPLVETGAADAFRLGSRELAIACASHSGEQFHVKTVAAWQRQIGCNENDLACGAHLPMGEAATRALLRGRKEPTRLHNNCSGKHTGFLCVACHLGEELAGYTEIDHPMQKRVRQVIGEMCDQEPGAMPWGIDGCTAPNFALPLKNLATGMARLADPAKLGGPRETAVTRLREAVKANPLYVAGTGRSDVGFIEASTGGTVTKIGAEGVFTAAIPSLGLGVALKIDDGTARAAETTMAAVLVALGILNPASSAATDQIDAPVRNWRGDVCGERRPAEALRTIKLA